jgi:adenine-specific DNA-methyltransferase
MARGAILHETTTHESAGLAEEYRSNTDESHKKEWGQFFTSVPVARFMASMFDPPTGHSVRVLDPGAGTGVLGLALAERLITEFGVKVTLTSVEKEPGALRALRAAVDRARTRLGHAELAVDIRDEDFLAQDRPRLGAVPLAGFDYIIANPPYFKMSPSETTGGDAPNAYARFMEVAARMLRDDGQLCFIVPRSFASGYYFRPFRKRFHASMRLDLVHVFESRRDAFRSDGVLQENIIVLYRRSRHPASEVTISSSAGETDLTDRQVHRVPRTHVLDPAEPHAVLSLPTGARDLRVMELFKSWRDTLGTYGLEVSTGPVVPFRATEYLRERASGSTVPMLWLQHVRPGRVEWPLAGGFRKQEHIVASAPSKLLVPNATNVLLSRFSAKEDARRLVAAPYLADSLSAPALGLENHLNFVRRPAGLWSPDEARALSALFNSSLFDAYFRVSNGNTQVSATELRLLPLPPREVMTALGGRLGAGVEDEAAVREVVSEG